jgi:hypothetical protein
MATTPTVAELQTLIQQLQAQVLALETAAATAAPTIPAATIAATTAVVFADTPQTLGAKDLIDYLSKRGSDIYKQGIAPLNDKALTDGFNMTDNQTIVFTEAIQNRATARGWNKGLKQITTFIDSTGKFAAAATLAVNPQFASLLAAMVIWIKRTNDGSRRHTCITC